MPGKTCVVVGATGGIGSEVVRRLARAGNDLVIAYRSRTDTAEALVDEVRSLGGRAAAVRIDARQSDDFQKLVETAEREFGGLDVWINLQGALRELALFKDETAANIEQSIDVELRSVIYACHAAVPKMIGRAGGRIITVGSDSGKVGSTGEAVSSACRGGVIAFSKALARELARHAICVNVVCPGPTATPLFEEMQTKAGLTQKVLAGMVGNIPLRRLGEPSEVAALVGFLASDDAAYITGQAISVSGGLTMC